MTDTKPREIKRLFILALIAVVFGFGAVASWAFSSPAGSSPDEDFHLASIWCGQGDEQGYCNSTGDPATREVPGKLTGAACYAFHAQVTGSCQGPDYGKDGSSMVTTERGNFLGNLYPPGFFYVMNTFVTDNVNNSVLSMRLFNAGIFVALLAGTAIALPARLRLALVGGAVVTIMPLGIFLIASANPSSWAIISGATLLMSLIGYLETTGKRRLILGALALISFLIGISSRSDAAAYAAVAVAAAVLISWRPSKRSLLALILPALIGVGSLLAFLTAGQSTQALSGTGFNGDHSIAASSLLFTNFQQLPKLWLGIFGLNWGLGWFDTEIPGIAWAGALFVFAAAVFFGLRALNWRKGLAGGMVLGALSVIPLYILIKAGVFVGAEVQPRYVLPLITMLAAIMLLPVAGRRVRLTWPQTIAVILLLSVANAASLYANLRRYVNGNTANNIELLVTWRPLGVLGPMGLWAAGSIAFTLALIAIALLLRAAGTRSDDELRAAPADAPLLEGAAVLPQPRTRRAARAAAADLPALSSVESTSPVDSSTEPQAVPSTR